MQNERRSSERNPTTNADTSYFSPPPAVTLPKGGGAIQGIGEKFAANPVTGTASLSIPIVATPSRSDFYPKLSLSYDSGAGNSPFGFGWTLSVPSVVRKTEKGLPQYQDAIESDIFILSEAEDLVPQLTEKGDPLTVPDELFDGKMYTIRSYRPRIEGLFARIQRWQNKADSTDVFWKSVSKDNVTSLYGYGTDSNSRIADPADASRIFKWLLAESHDDKGNRIVYHYKGENLDNVDRMLPQERNRLAPNAISANRYLQFISYGKHTPGNDDWLFRVVFDYGEYDSDHPNPEQEAQLWHCRQDAFSSFRAGFEIRTYRLCRRVLMFHHFAELGTTPCLTKSTDFTYLETPIATYLQRVTQTGYVRDSQTGTYGKKSLPPLEFTYTQPVIDETVQVVDPASLANVPAGLDGTRYQWLDLDSEGLSGILTEQSSSWFYKRNLGNVSIQVPQDRTAPPQVDSNGTPVSVKFGPVELVATKPSVAHLGGGQQQFMDLAGDGTQYLVEFSRPLPGYYQRTADGQWDNFIPFEANPNIDWNDPNLKFIDVNGDGHPDLLVSEHDVFVWYPSRDKDGFGSAETVLKPWDEETGPALVFADGTQSLYLADMKGDGLTDIVRIRNGEVCYWPNLGYGRFGAKVMMDASPWFEYPDLFEQKRIRLGDIDGSGTTDIFYLGRDAVSIWFNQSGNSWSPQPQRLENFPPVDDLASVTVVDLLGNGTACLVWASPLPGDTRQPMRYIDLMSGKKPHLLVFVKNNMGMEQTLDYTASTRFYLEDRFAGRDWVTKLPFPVHVLTRVESHDTVTQSRLVTLYRYHHGYYDGVEREFRGFGLVEQWDTEFFSNMTDEAFHVPSVYTKTWFHTGAYLDRENISQHFEHEYYREPNETLLSDSFLPTGLTPQEEREACRALKGRVLRQEVYALDSPDKQVHPYGVSEHNYEIRRLQPVQNNRYGVFYACDRESVDYHYERNPADPRVTHQMTLEVDDFGNVLKSASIAYPRRKPQSPEQGSIPDQLDTGRALVTYTENRVANEPSKGDWYRIGVPVETSTYEITGLADVLLPAFLLYVLDDMRSKLTGALEILYEGFATHGSMQKRPIERTRMLYRHDIDANTTDPAPLPLGDIDSLALPCESFKLAFTPGLLAQVYSSKISPGDLNTLLSNEGKYVQQDGNWWIPSGRQAFDPNRFYLPIQSKDPFGNLYSTTYDTYSLLVIQTVDPLNNTLHIENNYRTMHPEQITDPNGNQARAAFDILGMVVGMAVMGKDPGLKEGDLLTDDFKADLSPTDIKAFFDATDPHTLAVQHLGTATTRFIYDLDRFPVCAAAIAREKHVSDLDAEEQSKVQLSFVYSDGFGRVAQTKVQAESGPLDMNDPASPVVNPRWVGTGTTVYNNKGKPVRQFEPFFSPTHTFGIEQHGVSSTLFYDPLERVVATLHPNHTYEKVVFTPWQQETWDVNDTIKQEDPKLDEDVGGFFKLLPDEDYLPAWYTRFKGSASASERDAAIKAAAHANTPIIAHFDVLGRPFLTIADNGSDTNGVRQLYETHVDLDIEGNQLVITDARKNPVMINALVQKDAQGKPVRDAQGNPVILGRADDLLGHQLYSYSMDAGERWMLHNVAGHPMRTWDSRGHKMRSQYDVLLRLTHLYVQQDNEPEALVERLIYGEAHPQAEQHNLRGKVFQDYDCAGVVSHWQFDFKGNLLRSSRQLATSYRQHVNWSALATLHDVEQIMTAASPLLEEHIYATSTIYDALNRPIQLTTPDNSAIHPVFNEANLLEQVHVNLRKAATATAFVTNIDYDAKGQRTLIEYANGVRTVYSYDEETYRLTRLLTTRNVANGISTLQDLNYTYDPVGNITDIRDDAQQTIFFNNAVVSPSTHYVYDPLYRLLNADGREHRGQTANNRPQDRPELKPHYDFNDSTRINLAHPNDGQAMRAYTEEYQYDAVGNILAMIHTADAGNWTRHYDYAVDSNRLRTTNFPADGDDRKVDVKTLPTRYIYDAHGNMTQMPHLPLMQWDYRDQLQASSKQIRNDGGTPEITYYVYDASGQRVRKVTERQTDAGKTPTRSKERIYLGGFEIYREFSGDNTTVTLERETLHIMDNKRRIALVETKTVEVQNGIGGAIDNPTPLIRYQLDNHLGSASLELDKDGQILSYEEYHPYGTTSYQAGRTVAEVSLKRYRYTGKERDEETGLYYHGARYYACWLGRWTSCDPVGMVDGINLYRYAGNSPLRFVDPNGYNSNDFQAKLNQLRTETEKSLTEIGKARGEYETALNERAAVGSKYAEIEQELRNLKLPSSPPSGSLAQRKEHGDKVLEVLKKQNELEAAKERTKAELDATDFDLNIKEVAYKQAIAQAKIVAGKTKALETNVESAIEALPENLAASPRVGTRPGEGALRVVQDQAAELHEKIETEVTRPVASSPGSSTTVSGLKGSRSTSPAPAVVSPTSPGSGRGSIPGNSTVTSEPPSNPGTLEGELPSRPSLTGRLTGAGGYVLNGLSIIGLFFQALDFHELNQIEKQHEKLRHLGPGYYIITDPNTGQQKHYIVN